MLLSAYSYKDILLKEDHPLALNLSFAISLGLLPVTLSIKTAGCGIKDSGLSGEEADDAEISRLCKLRCFPPVALAWDPTSGLHVFPNFNSETVVVDSSPALWSSTGSEKTTVLLLIDPHCSYKTSIAVPLPAAASRFSLLYNSQIIGFSVAVVFFAVMRQALARPVPSLLRAVEANLRIPVPFLVLSVLPILISLFLSYLWSQPFPPFLGFTIISVTCYLFANGFIILLILVSQLVFYAAAYSHVFIKGRWQLWEGYFCFSFLHSLVNLCSGIFSLKVVRVLRANPLYIPISAAIVLSTFVHPALGLFILLLSHVLCCHTSLCNSLTASLRTHARKKELSDYKIQGNYRSQQFASKPGSPSKDNSSSYVQTQKDIFHYRHGLLILHLLGALMFGPSLISWLQRIGMHQSFPRSLDSSLCICLILHGIFSSGPLFDSSYSFVQIMDHEVGLNSIYLVAGLYSYISALALKPYRTLYAMGAIGVISFVLSISGRWKGAPRFGRRRHSHKR